MKLPYFVTGSLVLNAALLGFVLLRPATTPSEIERANLPVTEKVKKRIQLVTNEVKVAQADVVRQLDWRELESADFREYMARLEAAGCPTETIRDIIIADVNKLYASKWKSAMKPEGGIRYWDAWDSAEIFFNRQVVTQRRVLDLEKKALIQELLGVTLESEMRKQAFLSPEEYSQELLLAFLSPEKRAQVDLIAAEAADQRIGIVQDGRLAGQYGREIQPKLAEIEAQETARLKQILNPTELKQYRYATSDAALRIRRTFEGFAPTQQEFIALFDAEQANRANALDYSEGPPSKEEIQAKVAAQAKTNDDLKLKLGQVRYEEYQRFSHPRYRTLYDLGQEQNLSRTIINQAWDIAEVAENETFKLWQNKELTPDARKTAHNALIKETATRLIPLLGPEGYQKFATGTPYGPE